MLNVQGLMHSGMQIFIGVIPASYMSPTTVPVQISFLPFLRSIKFKGGGSFHIFYFLKYWGRSYNRGKRPIRIRRIITIVISKGIRMIINSCRNNMAYNNKPKNKKERPFPLFALVITNCIKTSGFSASKE